MPLPKAPSRPADILEDYGAPAKPQSERTLPKVKNVVALLADEQKSAVKPETEQPKKPSRRTRKRVSAQPAPAPAPAEAAAAPKPATEKKSAKKTKQEASPGAAETKTARKAEAAKRTQPQTAIEAEKKSRPMEETSSKTLSAQASKAKAKAKAKGKPSRTQKDAAAFAGGRSSSPGVQGSLQGRKGRARVADGEPRLFVLDTNVLMHDPLSLFRFAEHDVFLPMTTLEELDNHKKGLTDVARNARSVSRTLDALI